MVEQPAFYTVDEVAKLMRVSKSKAYEVIQELNHELKSKGYVTISGRISAAYLKEKIYM